jgi:hypothetical protein
MGLRGGVDVVAKGKILSSDVNQIPVAQPED